MDPISVIALAVAGYLAGLWIWFRIERWWAERRVRQIHEEVIAIARKAGIPDSELETYCDGCKRFSVGPVCPFC